MKKSISAAAAAMCLAGALLPGLKTMAQDQMGTVSYALPQTTIVIEVEAVRETFHAGPYAKYAQKYLGVEARTEDQSLCHLSAVRMTPTIEADQNYRYYINPGKDALSFLSLTSQGLIAVSDGSFGEGSQWRFTSQSSADFSDRGVSSNLTSEAATLYRADNAGASYGRVGVQQNMVVQKSLEQRAQEAASTIFELRKKRIQIVTGDTDATYSGEAMGAALSEIEALEKEYMSLFTGYSDFQTQKLKCDVVPAKDQKGQTYIAFRVSDTDGIVTADNVSGKPYLLKIEPQKIADASGKASPAKGNVAVYRIPAICTVVLSDGVNPVLQDRMAIYQLGRESWFPLGK
ncbi:MAG: DUF4831 family protein [Bacteroidales bacterium]|nr:DUF4831 family protein [Bacteroidales bacterium]